MNKSKRENFDEIWRLSGVRVSHRFITAGGIRTSYIEVGEGDPLLLLHGAGLGSVVWYQVVKELAHHHRVICPDKPGYGESDNPNGNYDRAFYISWLYDFTEAIGLKQFDLLGNSQGGAVSIAYALAYPNQVRKLILSNTAGVSENWPLAARGAIIGFNLLPSALTGWNLGRYTTHIPENIHDQWREYSLQVVKEKGGKRPILVGMGRATKPFEQEKLRKLKPPTLIIWGSEEKLFPVWHAEKLHQLIPNSSLEVINEAGHLPFLDQPNAFNKCLLQFLSE